MIKSYNELPLGLFLKVNAVLEDKALDMLDQQAKIIALLSGKTENEIYSMPLAEYSRLAVDADFLRETCPPATAPSRVIVGDVVLIPVQEITEITTAQYIDFQTFSKQGAAGLVGLLSVFLLPEGHSYNDGYDMQAVKEAVARLDMPVAMGLVGFLFASLLTSIRASLSYLDKMATRLPTEKRENLAKEAEKFREKIAGLGLSV